MRLRFAVLFYARGRLPLLSAVITGDIFIVNLALYHILEIIIIIIIIINESLLLKI